MEKVFRGQSFLWLSILLLLRTKLRKTDEQIDGKSYSWTIVFEATILLSVAMFYHDSSMVQLHNGHIIVI